jgi:hypothetical protein
LAAALLLALAGAAAAAARVDLLPLGTGKGASAVYDGEPSSAFVVRVGTRPVLLADVGLGAVRQCLTLAGALPRAIFVSHNHTDHAGELPVVVIVEAAAGRPVTIVAAPAVLERLRTHRLAELESTGRRPEQLARWLPAPEGANVDIGEGLSLQTVRGRHSEISYGFLLLYRGELILGWSADSGFDAALYEALARAPHVVVDARASGTAEHAGFDEVARFVRGRPGLDLWVTHYGSASEAPAGLPSLKVGRPLTLLSGD